jgi:predicted alpha/beta hydrolase family esterase
MRLLESMASRGTPLAGCILVATAYTDLDDEDERRSGYFTRPWQWEQMIHGASQIVVFHGTNDHLIPVQEARYIANQLHRVLADHDNKSSNNKQNRATASFQYHEMKHQSHFFEPWPELLDAIDAIVSSTNQE